jgi:hypothetical protein
MELPQPTHLRAHLRTFRNGKAEKIRKFRPFISPNCSEACRLVAVSADAKNYTFARANVVIAGKVGGAAPLAGAASLGGGKPKAESGKLN